MVLNFKILAFIILFLLLFVFINKGRLFRQEANSNTNFIEYDLTSENAFDLTKSNVNRNIKNHYVELPPKTFAGGSSYGTGQIDKVYKEYFLVDGSYTNETTEYAYMISNNNNCFDLIHFGLGNGDDLEISYEAKSVTNNLFIGIKVHFVDVNGNDIDTGENNGFVFNSGELETKTLKFKIPNNSIKFLLVPIIEKNKGAAFISKIRILSKSEFLNLDKINLDNYGWIKPVKFRNRYNGDLWVYSFLRDHDKNIAVYEGFFARGSLKTIRLSYGESVMFKNSNGDIVKEFKLDKKSDPKMILIE